MSLIPHVVVTSCTTRKALGRPVRLVAKAARGDAVEIADRWRALIRRTPPLCRADQLYKGRGVVNATAAASLLGAQLHFVSAGLGLISARDLVPSYDLTVATRSLLAEALAKRGEAPKDWWAAINRGHPNPLSALLARSISFVALPATYLALVRDDLARLPKEAVGRLRIFTSESGRDQVPPQLADSVMPYDDRLETAKGFTGTRAEFPQRSLRHFVEVLGGPTLSLDESRLAVERCMTALPRRVSPQRERASDEKIRSLLRRHWHAYDGSSARLLRYLRDVARVSCEQSRFRDLWNELTAEMETDQ